MRSSEIISLTEAAIAELARGLVTRAQAASAQGRRFILGLAGIPGSGKSTLAAKLASAVEAIMPGITRIVPMDGFHFSNQRLDALGLRALKGSPATFDADGFIAMLRRAKHEDSVAFPVYDRALHEPVVSSDPSSRITRETKLIITEGNYLLLDAPPWSALGEVLDECWWIDTPLEQARQWIIARHIRGGRDIADAAQHYGRTDQPNATLVLAKMRGAEKRVRWA